MLRELSTIKTEIMPKLSIVLLVLIALSVVGCGSKFACNNAKGGIRCETITSVYESIQAGEKIDDKKPWNYFYERSGKSSSSENNALNRKSGKMTDGTAQDIVRNLDINDKKPLRLPTKIIGIWIAPWIDAQGDLRRPEMIYSEIQDKRGRWLFGEEEITHSNYVTNPVRRIIDDDEKTKTDKAQQTTKEKEQHKVIKR